jgi:hypothetical protein
MQFVKAERKRAKLRLALSGPAGSGKTWGALAIAKGLGGKIAVIDTERGSASLYSDLVEFDVLDLAPPFSPERYIAAIKAAEQNGFEILVIDSISHEWNGSGGCLEINEGLANSKFRGNTWAAWNATTPRHRAFIDAVLQSPMHIIATMRSKTETVQGEDKKIRKIGMKSEARDGTEYEFAVVLECTHDTHQAVATKDRTRLFPDPHIITAETGERLRQWLDSGAEPALVTPDAFVPPSDDEDPVVIADKMVAASQGLEPDAAMILEIWNKVRGDRPLAERVWTEIKASSEFETIKEVLRSGK